jgi:flagellar assembly protein FliH
MATIIRNNSSSEVASGQRVQPVAFNFENMNDRANEYLESVRREAAKIVQQANQQAESIRRQAEILGRATAQQVAQKALEQKIADRFNAFNTTLEQIVAETTSARDEWIRRWESTAVAVVIAIAERVIRREVREQPKIKQQWITEALHLAAGAADVSLHLHPADYDMLGDHAEKLSESLGKLAPTHIVSDPDVTEGGCIVQTRLGRIDQQIEAQLTRIQEELA